MVYTTHMAFTQTRRVIDFYAYFESYLFSPADVGGDGKALKMDCVHAGERRYKKRNYKR